MKIMSRSKLAKEKVKKIQAGFSAFAESKEVSDLIKKEIDTIGLDVIVDQTTLGSWFIPKQRA
ncbi:hypothetical protein [Alteribacter populi]|uniref:hypothetical protein n=1 Tax=Alteribacter populi TaxID=2011011 RepID=UPI000BBAB605|nr:hypothetical protein [Alteribacter populi]